MVCPVRYLSSAGIHRREIPGVGALAQAYSQDWLLYASLQIMDLHKTLNRLAASCAEEVVAGAHAHSLGPDDRPLVEAFMHGVDSTRALKFDPCRASLDMKAQCALCRTQETEGAI
jgi:hypothetical protein